MREARTFPYRSIPVYNPQSLSKEEAIAQFHVRQGLYRLLLESLREERPSHVLLIGTRGMGKSTLLQRIRYGVEDDPALRGEYLTLVFPEELYSVNKLHQFLLNTLDALADALEQRHETAALQRVENRAAQLGKLSPEEIQQEAPRFLAEVGQSIGKRFLLLVDNADRLFETIEKTEQWTLREQLSTRPELTLFGATTQASEGIYDHNRAFFEFFSIHHLNPLTEQEVKELLLRLSETVEEADEEKGSAKQYVQEWIASDPARLRTLVQLTGGNPRTTVLLFHLVLDRLAGGAREYLEQLLDQSTSSFKGRVDDLPPLAQQVLNAVALRWDPVTAMEVAEDTGLETTSVSTYLTRLVRQGILEKVESGSTKKTLYQIAERFFNIWYLMRASRRVRAKLRWFVEFLRVFFGAAELEVMAREQLAESRGLGRRGIAQIEHVVACYFASGAKDETFREYVRSEYAEAEPAWKPMFDAVLQSETSPWNELPRTVVEPESRSNRQNLGTQGATRGHQEFDAQNAGHWIKSGVDRMRATNQSDADALRYAEFAFRKAIELNPDYASAWNNLGLLLSKQPNQQTEAEAAYRRAIELNPNVAPAWYNLGTLLSGQPDRQTEVEAAYRRAIELDPNRASAWNNLGNLLSGQPDRQTEAEAAYRRAIELDPNRASAWHNLGWFLACQMRRLEDAEIALRRAKSLDPDPLTLRNLGVLLYCELHKEAEGEELIREAYHLEPENNVSAAVALACSPKFVEENPGLTERVFAVSQQAGFWSELFSLYENYPPFEKILRQICNLVLSRDGASVPARLALAALTGQQNDFPRALVLLEDSLLGDPLDVLAVGRRALELLFAAAIRNGQVRSVISLLQKKEWVDAWRPIYEALRAVEAGSAEYLKRVAVELREPAAQFLRRIAPALPGLEV